MFWSVRERENKEHNGGPPCGQVRVLVVGDAGVGETSLAHLILKGSSISRPVQTIGCTVDVKNATYGTSGSSSNSSKGDGEGDFFVELWDISGHEQYQDCRSLFYSQINERRQACRSGLQRCCYWDILGSFGVWRSWWPSYIVIGNKADIAAKEGTRGSSGNLVDAARQWVEKQGLLSSSEELPLTESFPGSGGLLSAAKEARYDKEAVMKFFQMLIRRRWFSDELPGARPWLTQVHRPLSQSPEILSDEDQMYKSSSSIGDTYKYNTLPPLPAQHNPNPPPPLYPQQPMSTPDYYNIPRYASSANQEITTVRSRY